MFTAVTGTPHASRAGGPAGSFRIRSTMAAEGSRARSSPANTYHAGRGHAVAGYDDSHLCRERSWTPSRWSRGTTGPPSA